MSNLYSTDYNVDKDYKHSGFTITITSSIAAPGAASTGLSVSRSGNLYSLSKAALKAYLHSGFTTTVTSSIATPGTGPNGESVDASDNLYLIDDTALKAYQHSGFTTTITSSIATSGTEPTGISVDTSGNLYSNDYIIGKIYLHSGFTTTITSSIATPSIECEGVSMDALGNLYSIDASTDKAYLHSGFTTTITSSIATPGTGPGGVDWETRLAITFTKTNAGAVSSAGALIKKTLKILTGSIASAGAISSTKIPVPTGNLYSSEAVAQKIHKHSGFTTTILSSIATPGASVRGASLDDLGDLYSVDSGTDKAYKHSGFTTTITSSFSTPSTDPRGVSVDASENLYSVDNVSLKAYKHSGFTTTITSSIATPSTVPQGVSVDVSDNLYSITSGDDKAYKHSGFTTTISSSIAVPGTTPSDVSVDSLGNLYSADVTTDKAYQHSGFTTTITSSIATPATDPHGLDWDTRLQGPQTFLKGIAGVIASAGGISKKTLRKLTATIASAGTLLKRIHVRLTGIIASAGTIASRFIITRLLTGVVGLSGGLTEQVFRLIQWTTAGEVSLSGEVSFSSVFARTVSGVVSSAGVVYRKQFKKLTGAIGSVGVLATSGALTILRYAFDDQNPAVSGIIKYLVEIQAGSMPSGGLTDDSLYLRALRGAPEIEKSVGTVKGGVSGLSKVNLTLSNLDGKFNARNLDGFFVRLWRVFASQVVEFKGVVTEWGLGTDVDVTVEDREAVAFNDQVPKRVITKELFAKLPDKDAGKAVPVYHNRVTKIPCRVIGIDEAARNWDYLLGEGAGKFGNYQDVFTVYHLEAAIPDVSGTVASAGGSTVTLETADKRPIHYYTYWWLQVLDFTTLAVLDEIDIIGHTSEQVVTLSRNPTVSASGKKYRLKAWRFYNGSQVSPYPGVAFLRLKKRLGSGNSLDVLSADVNALPADNVVREIEDWLTNTTWGLSLDINQTSFDTLAGDAEISNIKTEWGVPDKTDAGDVIESLLEIRGMGLVKDSTELRIEADAAKTSSGTFGYADGYYDNIISFGSGVRHAHTNDRIKKLNIQYRRNYKEANTFLGLQSANANSMGIEQTLPVPMFYDHEDANRYLYYKVKKLITDAKKLTITVNEEGEGLDARDRITVKVPILGIDSDYLIERMSKGNGVYELALSPYDSTTYTWAQLGTYPLEPDNIIPTDFEQTNPAPVGGLVATGSVRLSETGDRIGFIDVSWTPPNDGNYMDAEVFVKKTSESSTLYKSKGFAFSNMRIDSLEANIAYDVLVESRNEYKLKGFGVEDVNNTTGSATTAPTTPTPAPTVDRTGRAWNFRVTPNAASQKIAYYVWEVATSAGTLVHTYDKAGTAVSYGKGGTASETYKARVKAVNIYGQESGFSSYSSSLATEKWQTDHINDDAVDSNKRIAVFTATRSRTGLTVNTDVALAYTDNVAISIGRVPVVTIETTSGMFSSPISVGVSISSVTSSNITVRTQLHNWDTPNQLNQSYTHVIKYW